MAGRGRNSEFINGHQTEEPGGRRNPSKRELKSTNLKQMTQTGRPPLGEFPRYVSNERWVSEFGQATVCAEDEVARQNGVRGEPWGVSGENANARRPSWALMDPPTPRVKVISPSGDHENSPVYRTERLSSTEMSNCRLRRYFTCESRLP